MDLPLPQFDSAEWDEGDEEQYEFEEGDEEDGDYGAEAEEIAKRLGDQLLADITKAQMEAARAASASSATAAVLQISQSGMSTTHTTSRKQKQEAALMTMRSILSTIEEDPQVRAVFSASFVSTVPTSSNVLAALKLSITNNSIHKSLAKSLSQALVSLAQNDTLFGRLKDKTTSEEMLERGKRKRAFGFGAGEEDDTARAKRVHVGANEYQTDLLVQISNAIHVVSSAFGSLPPAPSSTQHASHHPSTPLRVADPAFVSSIHHHLHQIFLFAVTSIPRATPDKVALLQDLARLIQMLGILTGIPIGSVTTPGTETDIGTAIYPCVGIPVSPPCLKTFSKLYSLRMHQARFHPSQVPAPGMHGGLLADRPYRCPTCPASFSRNHDLKRHVKLHEKKAWKCGGCDKIFSRRDAIKRHKDRAAKGLAGDGAYHTDGGASNSSCAYGQVFEVEVDKEDGEEEASRRAKLWNGIAAREGAGMSEGEGEEEGEVSMEAIVRAQRMVIDGVYEHLRSHVSSLAGTSLPAAPPSSTNILHPTFFQSASTPSAAPPPPMASLQGPTPVQEPQLESTTDNSSLTQWLSEEQTRLLEEAIAQAAAQAQAQAEAEAALEEQEEDELEDEDVDVDMDGEENHDVGL